MDFSTYLLHLFSRQERIASPPGMARRFRTNQEIPIGGSAPWFIVAIWLAWTLICPVFIDLFPPNAFHIPAILTAAYMGWFLMQVGRVDRRTWLRWLILALLLCVLSWLVFSFSSSHGAARARICAGRSVAPAQGEAWFRIYSEIRVGM